MSLRDGDNELGENCDKKPIPSIQIMMTPDSILESKKHDNFKKPELEFNVSSIDIFNDEGIELRTDEEQSDEELQKMYDMS